MRFLVKLTFYLLVNGIPSFNNTNSHQTTYVRTNNTNGIGNLRNNTPSSLDSNLLNRVYY